MSIDNTLNFYTAIISAKCLVIFFYALLVFGARDTLTCVGITMRFLEEVFTACIICTSRTTTTTLSQVMPEPVQSIKVLQGIAQA